MKLSIVTTMYYSAPFIREFYERISASAKKITHDYEIIIVNDGSPDDSLQIALSIYEKDSKIKVIDLSRNFNHHKAIMTGLAYAKGDIVFIINADLEESPEQIEVFYRRFVEEADCDLLYGVIETRKGSNANRIIGKFFYASMSLISDVTLSDKLASTRMMSKRFVDSLIQFREYEVFFAGLLHITGFKQVPLLISSGFKGSSTYSLQKKIALSVAAITSFSDKPLVYIFYFGFVIFFIASLFACSIIFKKVVYGIQIFGWASLIVSVWLIGGLMILFLGVIGIYLSKIFIETKKRPYTIIRNIYDRN